MCILLNEINSSVSNSQLDNHYQVQDQIILIIISLYTVSCKKAVQGKCTHSHKINLWKLLQVRGGKKDTYIVESFITMRALD